MGGREIPGRGQNPNLGTPRPSSHTPVRTDATPETDFGSGIAMPSKTPAKGKDADKVEGKGRSVARIALHVIVVAISILGGLVAKSGGPTEFLWQYANVPAVPDADRAIFVGIASYCDKELNHTLTDLFNKAKFPERVYVGLVNQEKAEIRDGPSFAPWREHPNVRVMEFTHEESKGAGWARSNIVTMFRGEAYYMQLDSHHLFVRNWDAACVDLLKRLQKRAPKPILTSYVNNYPENETDISQLVKEIPWRMTAGHWMKPFTGIRPKKIQYLPAPIEAHIMKSITQPDPQITAFFSAHFVFVKSSWLNEVPYDPEMYFDGEEDSLGLRSWTSGYDLYYPTTHLVFHRYERHNQTKHWDDHPQVFHDMTISSTKRLSEIIGTKGGPDGSDSLGKFGLGKVRTIEQYQDFSGIDYTKMWISTRARYGEITARRPSKQVPKLWVHKDGHFQCSKHEEWGEVWEEWKHQGSVLGKGKDAPMKAHESIIVSKWNVTGRDLAPPRPNLHMVDENRGMEMNLTPEGCFYRYPNKTDSPQHNWTLMAYGYWM